MNVEQRKFVLVKFIFFEESIKTCIQGDTTPEKRFYLIPELQFNRMRLQMKLIQEKGLDFDTWEERQEAFSHTLHTIGYETYDLGSKQTCFNINKNISRVGVVDLSHREKGISDVEEEVDLDTTVPAEPKYDYSHEYLQNGNKVPLTREDTVKYLAKALVDYDKTYNRLDTPQKASDVLVSWWENDEEIQSLFSEGDEEWENDVIRASGLVF